MSRTLPPLLLSAILLVAGPALAGGIAEIESGTASERVRAQLEFDRDRLRIEVRQADHPEGYMIFRDGTPYSVAQFDGQIMVMDMSGMLKMTGQSAQQGGAIQLDEVAEYLGLHATGRAETVGGVRGEVHRLDYRTGQGVRDSKELVLATNSAARELTVALMGFSTAMASAAGVEDPEGSRELQAELDRRRLGVLRYGDEFRLLSLSSEIPAARRFELPAEPMQMPAGMPGMGGAGDSPFGGLLGDKVERQKERIGGRTEAEADAATDRAVDKVLDKAFGKLFGGQ